MRVGEREPRCHIVCDVQFRLWDSQGAPVANVTDLAEPRHLLEWLGIDQDSTLWAPPCPT